LGEIARTPTITSRNFQRPTALDPSHHISKIHGRNFSYWHPANQRENVRLQPGGDVVSVTGIAICFPVDKPFSRHRLEVIDDFLGNPRVNTSGQLLTSLEVAPLGYQ
jgi:hypothetical protein